MSPCKYRFGDFLLDPARRELWQGETPLRLPPKAFDCLVYLVEHRNRAVGRDELIAAVWGRTEVDDNLLDQAMTRLRRVLADTDEERRLVRTVPRFGYSWAAPVQVLESGSAEPAETAAAAAVSDIPPPAAAEPAGAPLPPAPGTAPTPATAPRWPRWLLPTLALLAIALLAWLYLTQLRPRGNPAANTAASLGLVLPVRIKAEPAYAWARLGVMDLVAERLRAAGQATVPSDNVVALARQFGNDTPAPALLRELAQSTSAALVIESEAEFSAGYWRVSLSTVYGREPALRAEGESQDLMDAARAAADRLASLLGYEPLPENDLLGPRERALSGVLRQADAAVLADQIDSARALLQTLDAEQGQRPEVRFRLAYLDFRAGKLDAAQAGFDALLAQLSPADDPILRARVLNALGNIAFRRDDYAAVEQRSDEVIALLGNGRPNLELGRALTGRANARSAAQRFDEALPDLARARVVLESVGDRLGLARVDANLGILDARRDRFAEALPLLDAAARRLAVFHDLTNEMFARVAAGLGRLSLLQPAAALADEQRLGELLQREPNPQWRRYIQLARSEILAANGQNAAADALLQEALADARAAHDEALLGSARVIGVRRAVTAGRFEQAEREATALLQSRWAAETPREQAALWLNLARAQVALKRYDAARATAQQAHVWAAADTAPVAQLFAQLIEAETQAPTDHAAATAAFDAALRAAEAGRVPEDLLAVSDVYARWLIEIDRAGQAGVVAARSAAWADSVFEAALLQARVYRALKEPAPWRAAILRARHLAAERPIPAELDALPPAGDTPR
ncbi:DNA-binding winged helix-turn-helix (wHTH) protein [Tahibacter aquaticus]|uniref:DNA-binding winged helix-turn-helix (WHTH) protein n=1 Tax=Tahibacter aquaticus TaxID=520092 RepID=A0A4R6ZA77_9GAMM|nr:winged helix-turn-helix domain-containing protein [Tahibacter aquaticus]TDR48838.1 DNA-binding winged helix-turn-helix (wHTH) protein [Tahibacter aquaticus]